MKIVEDKTRLQELKQILQTSDSFWAPVFSDLYRHYVNNTISFVYIYIMDTKKEYIVPFRHKDCYNLNIELLNNLTSPNDIYVLAKKRFTNFSSLKCYDADMVAWWQTHKMLPLDLLSRN